MKFERSRAKLQTRKWEITIPNQTNIFSNYFCSSRLENNESASLDFGNILQQQTIEFQ